MEMVMQGGWGKEVAGTHAHKASEGGKQLGRGQWKLRRRVETKTYNLVQDLETRGREEV